MAGAGGMAGRHNRLIPGAGPGLGIVPCLALALLLSAPAMADTAADRLATVETKARDAIARKARFEAEARARAQAADENRAARIAVAARIQKAERAATGLEARIARLDRIRAAERRALAEQQAEITRLLASLQTMARRPALLMLAQPESALTTARTRAVMDMLRPVIDRRTARLRADIAKANRTRAMLRDERAQLSATLLQMDRERKTLATLEQKNREAQNALLAKADLEADRASGLALQAGDLRALIASLGDQARLRATLARLPGPQLRPAGLTQGVGPSQPPPILAAAPPLPSLQLRLPVEGRLATGWGATNTLGLKAKGLTFAVREGAQVVAPAKGRIAFAGPFRTYGRIVIIEHDDMLMSLVAGLGDMTVATGDDIAGGEPIGHAAPGEDGTPEIYLEVRRNGEPVNPMPYVSAGHAG